MAENTEPFSQVDHAGGSKVTRDNTATMTCFDCGHSWVLHGGGYFERWCIGFSSGVFCGCRNTESDKRTPENAIRKPSGAPQTIRNLSRLELPGVDAPNSSNGMAEWIKLQN